MRALRFTLISIGSVLGILYIIFLVVVYFGQESLIFHVAKLSPDFKYTFEQPFEEMQIASEDGTKLNGVLFKTEKPRGAVLYLHGNAGTIDSWSSIAPDYAASGYDLLILDYRGYGKSDGDIDSEAQFYGDVSAAYDALAKRYDNIVIVGYSIGTGPAAYLASKYTPSALVLQAPYYNLVELADSRVPFVPDFLKKYRFETNLFLPKVKCPVYIFHGTDDRLISFSNGERLHKLMPEGQSELFPLEGVGHGGINQDYTFLSELKIILDKAAEPE
jgi:pimeloyl-ACP methyl ester carboxylesterase